MILFQKPLLGFIAIVAAIVATIAYFYPLPSTDTLVRYAPMAEAFAAGNWKEAFHPRFNIGMPIVAGLWHLCTGMDAWKSCAVVSSLAWAFAVFPLFLLTERIFDRQVAWFAVILYAICPQDLIWAFSGLRESFKILGLLLLILGVFRATGKNDQNRGLFVAMGGVCLLMTFKVDSIPLALLFVFAYMCLTGFNRYAWGLFAWTVLAVQPACYLGWRWTGLWLPSPQFIAAWEKMTELIR